MAEADAFFGEAQFAAACPVSDEILEKLSRYHALLLKWQKAINLVSSSTLSDLWRRHFLDSAQLAPLLPGRAGTLVDLGSGAGFPGMVLAMMCPDVAVHLIESDTRKCAFLRAASRETSTPVSIHNVRIAQITGSDEIPVPDVVTARALAELKTLLDYAYPWALKNPALEMLFLKGAKAGQEICAAQKAYQFDCTEIPGRAGARKGGFFALPVCGFVHNFC